jgi:hypothetical protein
MTEVLYADTDAKISQVVAAALRASESGLGIGLDTEFYGVEVGKESTVARSRLHLLSIAVPRIPTQLHPRGYSVSDAAVFTREALLHPGLRDLLQNPNIKKAVHNLPVDAHTLENEGIALGGGINTLTLARYCWPERARGPGFTLDSLGIDLLGSGKLESFSDVFSEVITEYKIRTKRVTHCECGASSCRKRAITPGHRRLERIDETKIPKEVTREIPLESVLPGHPRWPRALAYSAQDAVLALAIYDLAQQILKTRKVEVPWLSESDLNHLAITGEDFGSMALG